MIIHLSKDVEQFVRDAVRAGLYASEDDVVNDAMERLRHQAPLPTPGTGLIGALRDDAEWLDEAVEHAMKVREERPWRLSHGEGPARFERELVSEQGLVGNWGGNWCQWWCQWCQFNFRLFTQILLWVE
jgi:Arc/MetJ-type ribon-helix-helix transcriptional regulator